MSPSSDATAQRSPADALSFSAGQVVLEFGYDDDVDFDLRELIEDQIDGEMGDESSQEIADAIIFWWRKEDGDLTDALVDAIMSLDAGAPIWLLTPKPGRDGAVLPVDVQEAASTAGLRVMGTVSLAPDWSGTRLASRN